MDPLEIGRVSQHVLLVFFDLPCREVSYLPCKEVSDLPCREVSYCSRLEMSLIFLVGKYLMIIV